MAGQENLGNFQDTDLDTLHECGTCINGEIFGVFNVSFQIELLKYFSFSIDYGKKEKLCDCYCSLDFGDFGLTTCPHKMYKTTFKVINPYEIAIPKAEVKCNAKTYTVNSKGEVIESSSDSYITDAKGCVSTYLKKGDYKITATDGNDMAMRTITVNNKPITKKLKKGDHYDLGKPIMIGYKMWSGVYTNEDSYTKYTYYENNVLKIDKVTEEEFNLWVGDDWYRDNGTNWQYFKENCEILIFGEGFGHIYTSCDEFVKLKEIFFPSTIENIAGTFKNCVNLKSIHCKEKDNKITIVQNAFNGCSSLTNLDLPKKCNIGKYSFANCTSLREIEFTREGTYSSQEFEGCTSLESVTINGRWDGGMKMFKGCQNLKKIKIKELEVPYDGGVTIYGGIDKNTTEKAFCLSESENLIIDLIDCKKPIGLTNWDLREFFNQFRNTGATILCNEDAYEELSEAFQFTYIRKCLVEETLSDGSKCVYPLKKDYPNADLKIIFQKQSNTSNTSFQAKIMSINNSNNTKINNIENPELFTNLIPKEEYLFCIMKKEDLENIFFPENILYIDQANANEQGELSFSYDLQDELEDVVIKLYGKKKAQTIKMDTEQIDLKPNETDEIRYTVIPEIIDDKNIEWQSSNENVVTVQSDGTINAQGVGTSTITLKIDDAIATCTINVTDILKGDINADGDVDLIDCALLLRHAKGIENLDNEQLEIANINQDEDIDLIDYALLLRHVKGIELLK